MLENSSTNNERFINRHARPVGIFLALLAGVMFATNGTLIKVFAVNFLDAVLVRCFIQTLIFGLVMVCVGLCNTRELRNDSQETSSRSKYILCAIISLQGLINASIIFTCYLAVLNIPIGNALAIIFSSPVFTLILTFLVLGHRHSLWKIIFAFIVFIGVVMIIKPPFLFGTTTITPGISEGNNLFGILMAVTTAILGGCQSTILHYLKNINSIILVFWTGVIGILECLVFGCFYDGKTSIIFGSNWNNFTFESVWQLLVIAIVGTLALVVTTKAYQLLDPTICVVLSSQEVLLGFIIQAYFFQDPVGIWNIFGGSLVLISGICISSESFFIGLYQRIREFILKKNDIFQDTTRIDERSRLYSGA